MGKEVNYLVPELLVKELSKLSPTFKTHPPKTRRRGCKQQILEEFNRRADTSALADTWEKEIKFLCEVSSAFGKPYQPESMRNIITRALYLSKS